MSNNGGKEGNALVSTYAAENLLYQESLEVGANQESIISFTWTPYESGSIQITSEIEEYDETISKYAYIQEAEEENTNPVALISAIINGVPVNEQFLNLERGDIASFTSSSSYDSDGNIVSFTWTLDNGINPETNNQENLNYKFDVEGDYELTLTVVDNDGGSSKSETWFIFVTAAASTGGSGNDDDDRSDILLIGGSMAGILALGAVVGLKYFRNEDEEEDFFDFEDMGPTILTCPSCSGQITITTDQRPIQVGCPMCQSQFIIRE